MDANGKELQPDEIRSILQRLDPKHSTGVGKATFARAIATRSALRGDGDTGTNGGEALLRSSAVKFGETEPLYSRARASAEAKGIAPPALSRQHRISSHSPVPQQRIQPKLHALLRC